MNLAKTQELARTGAVGSCDAAPLPASFIATVSKIAETLAAVFAEVSTKSIAFLPVSISALSVIADKWHESKHQHRIAKVQEPFGPDLPFCVILPNLCRYFSLLL